MRDRTSASSSPAFDGRGPLVDHVERELRGYLAAVEEGLPVLEPRSAAVAAVVIGQVLQWLVHSALARPRAQQLSAILGLPRRGLEVAVDSSRDLRIRRLRFARYLFVHGHING